MLVVYLFFIFLLQVLLKYTEYNEPHESLTNRNIIEVH